MPGISLTVPTPSVQLVFTKMRDLAPKWRARLHALCIQEFYAMSRWIHQNGACYVAILFVTPLGQPLEPHDIVAWSCMTFEDEPHPVLGVFVDEYHRGRGYAGACVTLLLDVCRSGIADTGGRVYAVATRYPKYQTLIERAGFVHLEWE